MPREYVDINSIDWSKFENINNPVSNGPTENKSSSKKTFVDPSKLNFNDFEPLSNDQQGSFLYDAGKKALQFAGGLATRAAQGAVGLTELPAKAIIGTAKALGVPGNGDVPYVSDLIGKAGKKVFGDIEPENALSKTAQYTAGALPVLALSGGLTAPKILSDLAGSAGMVFAEGVTDNPIAKIATSVLAQRGYNSLASKVHKSAKPDSLLKSLTAGNESNVSKAKQNMYDKKSELGKDIQVSTKGLNDKLADYKAKASEIGEFTATEAKDARFNVDKVLRKIDMPRKSAEEISELKTLANSFLKRKDLTSAQRSYYKGLNNVIKDEIKDIGKTHPEFYKNLSMADELHSLQNWGKGFDGFLSALSPAKYKSIVTNPYAQGAVAFMLGAVKGKFAAGAAGLAAALKAGQISAKTFKFLYDLRKTPEGQKILWQIIADAGKDSAIGLTKDLHALNNLADKFD